jgi:hypothetical protein
METLRIIVQIFLAITGIVLAIIGAVFTPNIVYKLRPLDPEERPKIAWVILLGCIIVEFMNLILLLVFTGGYILNRVSQDQKRYPDPIAISGYELKSYSFDPETILAGLKQGESNVFQPLPVDAYFDDNDVYNPGLFSWQQQDFLMTSNALYQFASNNTLKGWRVHGWWFHRECAGNLIGFDSARIAYFNPDRGENPTMGEHTAIEVNLASKMITWGENQSFESDSLFGWQSFDPAQIKITAEDALRIADEHGGKEARRALENQCTIWVDLYTNKNLWEVTYIGSTFEVAVDPYSGHYEIIEKTIVK